MIKKFCLTCGNEFSVSPRREVSAKFCSTGCKYASGRANRECLFCGKHFVSVRSYHRKYCSRKCGSDAKKKRVIKICTVCSKEYEVQEHAKDSTCCSIECRSERLSRSYKGRFIGKENPNYKEKVVKVCKYCGKKFKVHPYRKKTANHCSIRCSKLDLSEESRRKIAVSVRRLQEQNPKIHPNYILAQKGHVTQIEKLVRDALTKCNLSFKMQYNVLSYWIDFAFPSIKLAVECDGERWHSTEEQIAKDKKRDEKLEAEGWTVMRLKEKEVINDVDKVVNKILRFISIARGEGGFGSTGK